MVDRHAVGPGPWQRRGQSGSGGAAPRNPCFRPAGRAAVAARRRASIRSLQRPNANNGGAGGLPRGDLIGAVRSRRPDHGTTVGGGRASRPPCRAGAGHRTGHRQSAARCGAPAIVPAAAGAGEPRLRRGRRVRRQGDAKLARRAGPTLGRGAATFDDGLVAAGGGAGIRASSVPAARTGAGRPQAPVATRAQSIYAATIIAAAYAVDAGAGFTVAGIYQIAVGLSPEPRKCSMLSYG